MPIDDQLRAETRDLLQAVLAWTASRASWDQAGEILTAMNAALDAEDPTALDAAIARLEDLDPHRATDGNAGPRTPPPAPVRDRLNETIHKIGK
ncbi:CATRA system-associated protein [Frankia sp. QA3]|uniref:CATRA system-associated protein n=1 Tax=Frankia sp. QA3 TaxID=710111 RepID=UPI000269C63C|nr:CATRA system-associated protein [Frankia sp. QA3]EIV94940.1 hypothetical protein FraQA3DRAFT_4736 [Frankia sp. QA3]